MGINVVLITEQGETVEEILDPLGFLAPLLPDPDDRNSRLLRYIDPYGDTVFNQLQMDDFIMELRGLYSRASSPEQGDFLEAVERLAHQCAKTNRLHLKFYGD